MTRPASSTEEIDGSKLPPLLLHFDVNKTLIIADSIMNKSTEYTIREVIANQFWGFPTQVKSGESGELRTVWKWDGRPPSVCPTSSPNLERPSSKTASRRPSRNDPSPADAEDVRQRLSVPVKEATLKEEGAEPVSYLQFARNTVQGDQSAVRLATRSFERVIDAECKQMMLALAEQAVGNLLIPPAQRTEELQKETGLIGEWKLIFPSFFRLIANLQRERRHFAVMFRSFGTDLLRVCAEWNAFCEGKHPLLKECMEGVPKMDGSVPGVPDRRLAEGSIHTMYRDAEGPLLALGLTTNGNWEGEWDQWARSGSQDDTRGGRAFLRDQGVETVKGYLQLQAWFKEP